MANLLSAEDHVVPEIETGPPASKALNPLSSLLEQEKIAVVPKKELFSFN